MFDYINDQQATARDLELVGNATHPVFYTYYEDAGTPADTDDFIYFRVRLAGSKASSLSSFTSGFVFVGLDVNEDGAIDFFLSITQRTTNDQKISVWSPGSGANNSPSTTTIRDELIVANLKTLTSYIDFSPVTAANDPSATDLDLNTAANDTSFGGNSNDLKDHFLTFKLPFNNTTAAIDSLKEAAAAKGIALTKSTALRYLLATSTQSNALNSDLAGYNGGTKSSVTFDQAGAFSPTLSPSNIPPQITSNGGGSTAAVIVSSGTAVTTVTATDANGDTIQFSISGGADAALFTINSTTGALAFLAAPNPGTYVVQVRASDGMGASSQLLSITVPDPNDVTPPSIISVTSSTLDGAYNAGRTISIQVVFNEPVQVSGSPQVTLETGTTDRIASYAGGSGGNILSFGYTVQAGDTTGDLDYVSTAALALNGGTIRDANNKAATLTLPAPGASGSLGANKALIVDTTAPTYVSGSSSASGATVVLAFSDLYSLDAISAPTAAMFTNAKIGNSNITVASVRVDAAARTVTLTLSSSATAGQTVTLNYTDPSNADDVYAIQDVAGNDVASFAVSLTATGDSTQPQILGVSSYDGTGVMTSGHFGAGSVIPIKVEFTELVNVTGTPQLTLETGATDRVVNYTSGTGTNVLTFNYTVQAGDTAADLDYVSAAALALNGGTLRDAASNNAVLTLPAPASANSLGGNNDIVVDTTAPVFSSAKVTGSGLTVYFSDTNALDSTNPPATSAFAVTVAGASRGVSSVLVGSLERNAVLTLASAVSPGEAVTVAYTDPTAGNDLAALQDLAGNDVATFTAQAVTNLTGDVTPPTLVSINDNDADNVVAPQTVMSYTVTFSKDIDATTLSAADFSNTGTATISIGSIVETSATSGVFAVAVTPTTEGTILLQISAGAIVRDAAGNALDTASALSGGVDTVTVVTPVNHAPVITSNGGGPTASVNVPENTTAVTTVVGTDADGQTLTYTVTGGADAALFELHPTSGALAFKTAPDFEAPGSAASSNVYTVVVQASDGAGGTVTQTLTVTVTNVNETPTLAAISDASGTYQIALGAISLSGADVDAGDTLTYSATGLPVGVSLAGATISGTPTAAGIATVTVRVTDVGGLFAERTFTLTIAKATPTLSWSTPAAIVYGTALSGAQLNASAGVPGTYLYSPAAGAILGAGSRTLNVTFTPTDSANYHGASGSVSLTVLPATLTATANNASRSYGGANPSFGYTVSGWVNGDTAAILVGAPSLTTSATAASGVGTYSISIGQGTLSAPNYTFGFADGTLTIGKAPLTVTADNKSRVFGAANPPLTYTISGFVNGETAAILTGAPTLSTAATPASAAGAYPIEIAVGTLAAANYSFTLVDGTLTVGSNQPPVITSDGGAATANVQVPENSTAVTTVVATDPQGDAVTFSLAGGADVAKFSISSSGVLTFLSPPDFETPASVAGTNDYVVIVQAADAANALVTQTITVTVTNVNEAPTLAAVANASGSVSSALSAIVLTGADVDAGDTLTYSASGLPGGIALAGATLSGTPTAAGVTNVTVRVTDAGGLFAERTFNITVAQGASIVTWSAPAAIVYGTPLGGSQLNASANVPGTFSYTPLAGAVLPVGSHSLSASFTPTDGANYAPTNASVTLTVLPAPLTVSATHQSRAFGAANPTLGYTVAGFINGETAAVLSGAPSLSTTATTASAPGSYPISISAGTLSAANYSFSFVAGALMIGGNQPPVFSGGANASFSVLENSTAVATLAASDPESQPVTFSIAGGPDAAKFSVQPGSGELRFVAPPDYEARASAAGSNTYVVIVQAADSAGGTATQSVTVVVTNVNEPPSLGSIADVSGALHAPLTAIALTGSDVDAGDTLTYSASGLPPGLAVIGATISGTPKASGAANVTVRVTDSGGLFAERSFVITVGKGTTPVSWSNPTPIFVGTPLGGVQLNATSSLAGTFVYAPAAGTVLPLGTHVLTTTFTPNDSNYAPATATVTLRVESLPVTPTTITGFGPDTGTVGDGITGAQQLTLTGTAPAGSVVSIYDGPHLLGTTMARSDGTWTFDTPVLPGGLHPFTARSSEGGAASAVLPVRIVLDAPVASGPKTLTINSNGPVRVSDLSGPIVLTDPGFTPITVIVSVHEGALSLPDTHGATIVSGTGFNDTVLVLSGTLPQLNAALGSLVYQPARTGEAQSTDVLKIVVQGPAGTVGEISIDIFVQRSALGGVAAAVNISALVPPNKTLVSTEAKQWDRSLITGAPAIAPDGTLSFVAIDGQNGGVSRTTITVRLTFSDGSSADVEVPVTIYHPLLEVVSDVNSPAQLNPQTSLYEQKVRIVNTTPFELISFRVSVPNLPASVRLESASGIDAAGVPYIAGMSQLAPGAETMLTLEYFSADARPFANPFVKLELSASGGMPVPKGTPVAAARVITAYRGRVYVEFPTVAGKTYWIQYRDQPDESWLTSAVPLLGTGARVHWMDEGQPKTASTPPAGRAYRLIEAAPSADLPAIVQEPLGATVYRGADLVLRVTAKGQAPLEYQWYRDGERIAGASAAALDLRAVGFADAGRYQVVVSNAHGEIASRVAAVVLADAPSVAFSALSLRAHVETGERELLGSLTFKGSTTQRILLRAAGPSLATFGVADALADPRVSLTQDGVALAENDHWAADAAASLVPAAAAAAGAFDFPSQSRDAALLRNLMPGNYDVRIGPKTSAGGVVLFELFESEPRGKSPARVRSAVFRAPLGAGGRAVVGGFTVVGDAPVRVLVRALGPALRQRGFAGAADPRLAIFRGGAVAPLATNDNWGQQATGGDLTRLFAALGIPSPAVNSKDAAIALTLEPGVYTFAVDPVDGGEGLALVEIHAIDL